MDKSDAVDQAKVGFDEAYAEQMLELYADMVFRIALVQLRQWQNAEDVSQEVFIKLFACQTPFESDEHAKAWLIRVTCNQCRDMLKSAWYRRTVKLDDDLIEHAVELSDVSRAIMRLSLKDRRLILLHDYIGYTVPEMADFLRIRPAAIATRLHRIRKKLRVELTSD